MAGLNDGIPSGQIKATDITLTGSLLAEILSGATLQAGTTSVGAGEVGTSEIASQAITVPKQAFVGTGSPSAFGLAIETGATTIGAAGSGWAVFSSPFLATPVVTTGYNAPAGSMASVPIKTTGSCLVSVFPAGAVGSVNWIAVGSR